MSIPVIAVVGVSLDPLKYGNRVFTDMVKAGWNVYGINPKGGSVSQIKLFTSLVSLPEKPESVVTVVAPEITIDIVDQCQKLGIKEIWMQPGSESDEAILKAEKYGMKVHAHQCIMVQSGIWKS